MLKMIIYLQFLNSIESYHTVFYFTGFDLAESFSLRQTSCGGEKICFKLGSAPLIRDTR